MSDPSAGLVSPREAESQAVLGSAAVLINVACNAFESEYDIVLTQSKHVKTIQDILSFVRRKSNYSRISIPQYQEIIRELYEGTPQELSAIAVARIPFVAQHFLGPDGLIDANDLVGCIFMLYSRYGAAEKAQLLFQTFDANDDGVITREEMQRCLTTFFLQFLAMMNAGTRNPAAIGVVLDQDYTHLLPGLAHVFDVAKIPRMVDKAFAAADENGDGVISKQEWAQWTSEENGLSSEWGSIGRLLGRSSSQ